MFGEIIKSLFITSLTGSVLAGILAFVKPVTRKIFGYAWHYYIWLAVLIVFLLPVRISLPQNTAVSVVVEQEAQMQDAPQSAIAVINKADAPEIAAIAPALPDGLAWLRQTLRGNGQCYLVLLWLTGAVGLLLTYLTRYFLLLRKIRKTSRETACPELRQYTGRNVRVLENGTISMPFMTGVFRPILILPKRTFTPEQLHNILRHEMTHFHRRDILYKWFAVIVKCVHWFNPVIYYVVWQINTECEISCDLSATAKMNGDEEQSYVETILAMLPVRKTKAIPLTMGMAGNKKILKRRFEMMKNRRNKSRLMSVLSAVLAVFMLGTTVFASGVLSDMATDDYTVEITNNGDKVELINKPFVENGEVYLPLREMFEKLNINGNISWDNKKIDITLSLPIDLYQNNEIIGTSKAEFLYEIKIGSDSIAVNPGSENGYMSYAANTRNVPILRNGKTYITYDYMDYMLGGGTYSKQHHVVCSVYDKNGDLIYPDSFYLG